MSQHDLFHGTADYYARYRPPYPTQLLDWVRAEARVSGTGELLDLGCGTGEVAIPLSPHFQRVTAVDQEPDMIARAEVKAGERGIRNIRWLVGAAEQVDVPPGSMELVTIGSAFHWMDRPLVARRAREWLVPGGDLAVLGGTSLWTGTAAWQPIVIRVLRRWLGDQRRAGSGTFARPAERHEAVLEAQRYAPLRQTTVTSTHTWTLDAVVGYLYSTSFAARPLLGERTAAFEEDLRAELLRFDPGGTYQEDITYHAIVARPGPLEATSADPAEGRAGGTR